MAGRLEKIIVTIKLEVGLDLQDKRNINCMCVLNTNLLTQNLQNEMLE